MTFISAATGAERAKEFAASAAQFSKDDGVRELAEAVGLLAEAVAEIARSHHRAT